MPISTILARPQLVTLREETTEEERLSSDLFSPPETFLILDASIDESYTSGAQVTDFPVESTPNEVRTDVTDHVRILPRTLSINGIISDSPLPLQTLSLEAFTSGLGSSALAQTLGFATRSQLGYLELERLMNDRVPFDVVTGLDVYSPVLITSLNVTRNSSTGRALNFRMTVKEITLVDTEIVSDDLGFQATPGSTVGDAISLGAIP